MGHAYCEGYAVFFISLTHNRFPGLHQEELLMTPDGRELVSLRDPFSDNSISM